MKIKFSTVVFLILTLVLTTAAAPKPGTMLTLIETRNDPNGGILFVFAANGQFSDSQLRGTVHAQGDHGKYDLYCSQVSEDRVQCSTSKKTAGMSVVINLAGFIFWSQVPEDKPLPPAPTCISFPFPFSFDSFYHIQAYCSA